MPADSVPDLFVGYAYAYTDTDGVIINGMDNAVLLNVGPIRDAGDVQLLTARLKGERALHPVPLTSVKILGWHRWEQ